MDESGNRIETITKYAVKKLDEPIRFSGSINCSSKDLEDYHNEYMKKKTLDMFKD